MESFEAYKGAGGAGVAAARVWTNLPVIVVVAVFLITYPALVGLLGPSGANVFALLPVVALAWSFGLRGGLLGSLVMLIPIGLSYWGAAGLQFPAGAPERVGAMVAIGALVGSISDQRRKLKESQLLYTALLEHGPAMTYVWSSKSGIRFISPNVEALSGYSLREWKADFGGTAARILEPEDRDFLAIAFGALQENGRPLRASLRVRRRDGTLIWIDHHADCIERTADEITIQGTVIDVTYRQEVFEARKLSEAARAESEAKSRFLALMSHELRNPLNSVLGFAELLQDSSSQDLSERQARWVENIRASGEHLLALVNDVLDLSKVEAGRIDFTYEAIAAAEAISSAVEWSGPLAGEKGLKLTVESGPGQLSVWADRRRLHQILLNLLSNAIKFTDVGAITISCQAEEDATAIRVSDSGAGIPASAIESIFDDYSQFGSPAQSQGGTGLGLPLSRRLARAMGGEITVASRLGLGSTFTLSLPSRAPRESHAVRAKSGG